MTIDIEITVMLASVHYCSILENEISNFYPIDINYRTKFLSDSHSLLLLNIQYIDTQRITRITQQPFKISLKLSSRYNIYHKSPLN